jgi:hypothetical protein
MNQRVQEKRVKAGMADMSDGGLGEALQTWNEGYFRERGLIATLELSHSAMKNPDQQSKLLRKGTHWYGKREDRERKREERKFVIVVTKMEDAAAALASSSTQELENVQELPAENAMVELPAPEDAKYNVAEMPSEDVRGRVELPGDFAIPGGVSLGFGNEKLAPPIGFAELDSDTTQLLEKSTLSDKDDPPDGEGSKTQIQAQGDAKGEQEVSKEFSP